MWLLGVMSDEVYPRTLLELERRFSREVVCIECLAALRWPDVWSCPRLQGHLGRDRWRCGMCRYEISVMAGTVFQDSHLPLTIWFQAM